MSGKLNYPKAIEVSKPGAGRTIFDGPGQHVECDVSKIRLLGDRVLIRDVPQDDSRYGLLVIPEEARNGGVGKGGLYRIGVVVATGPGDAYLEWPKDRNGTEIGRELITRKCLACEACGRGGEAEYGKWPACAGVCGFCDGTGRIPVVVPPQCQVGETVLYDRYRSEELILNGERFQLSHSEQTVIGVLEE